MTIDELGAAMVLDGATDTLAFEAYVEHCLVPTLWRGHVVVLDKLSAHTGTRVRERFCCRHVGIWGDPNENRVMCMGGAIVRRLDRERQLRPRRQHAEAARDHCREGRNAVTQLLDQGVQLAQQFI